MRDSSPRALSFHCWLLTMISSSLFAMSLLLLRCDICMTMARACWLLLVEWVGRTEHVHGWLIALIFIRCHGVKVGGIAACVMLHGCHLLSRTHAMRYYWWLVRSMGQVASGILTCHWTFLLSILWWTTHVRDAIRWYIESIRGQISTHLELKWFLWHPLLWYLWRCIW